MFPHPRWIPSALFAFAAMDSATIASTSSGKTTVVHDNEHIHDQDHEFRKEQYVVDAGVPELLNFELDPKPHGYYSRYPNAWIRVRYGYRLLA